MGAIKRLVFLENDADAVSFINSYAARTEFLGCVIYAFGIEAERQLMKHHIAYKIPEEAVSYRDYESIDKDSIRFAEGWHREVKARESLLWNGVSLGSLIQRDMAFFISVILDAIILSRKIIEHERPGEVYYFKRDFSNACRSVKAGREETFYGYFAHHFTPRTIGLTRDIMPNEEQAELQKAFLVEPVAGTSFADKCGNILLVRDADYLDAEPALIDVLGSRYLIKCLRIDGGTKEYRLGAASETVEFDTACLEHFFRYQNIDFFNAVRYKLLYLKTKALPHYRSFLDALKVLLRAEEIGCVIVAEDAMPFNKTVVSAAKSMSIPTIVLQKGVCAHDISFVPVTGDRFAAWGQAAKDYLVGRGVAPEKVELVGALRFQGYKSDASMKAKVRVKLNIGERYDKLFLAALQHGNRDTFFRNVHFNFHEELKMLKLLIRTMRRFPGDALCIKFHPQDELGARVAEYLGEEIPDNVRLIESYPIKELLSAADALITCFSTTALEALLMNIPVIVINVFGRPFNIDFAKEGIAAGVYRDEDLFEALSSIKVNGNSRSRRHEWFTEYHFFQRNVGAAKNLEKLLDSMIGARGKEM